MKRIDMTACRRSRHALMRCAKMGPRLLFVLAVLAPLWLGPTHPLQGSAHQASPGNFTATAGVFPNQANKTNSASLVVDSAGGIHIAFAAYGKNSAGKEPAYYGYCASGCAGAASWSIVEVSDGTSVASEVQVALTPAGQPRLLIRGESASVVLQYQYAACDNNCAVAANWTVTTVATTNEISLTLWDYSQHYFALDHLGRPRFVYYDNSAGHRGTFYASCNSSCTSAANWGEILLFDEQLLDLPSLSFTQSGLPRVSGVLYNNTSFSGYLVYLECSTSCESSAGAWNGIYLTPRGSGHASWVLRLDSQDRPRIAFYQASLDNGQGNQFYYLWCDATCLDPANWDGTALTLSPAPVGDPEADPAFDSQDRPHLSYRTGSPDFGLGYAWCEASCQSASGTWHSQLMESSTVLNAEWPLPPVAPCTFSSWYGGYRSALALDTDDNPIVFYDAEHLVNTGFGCASTSTDHKTVRLVVAGRVFNVYLPFVKK